MSLAGEENHPPEDRVVAEGGVAHGEPPPAALGEGAPPLAPVYQDDQGPAGDEPAPLEVSPAQGESQAGVVEDTSSGPSTRRAHFRNRPRDWWLLALLGKDTGGAAEPRSAAPQPSAPTATEDGRAAAGTMAGDRVALAEPTGTSAGASQAPAARARREPVAPARSSRARGSASAVRARQVRGLIAAILGLFLLGIAVSHLFAPPHGPTAASPVATPAPAPTSPAGPLTPLQESPITPLAVLGSAAKLNLPREAVTLPDGHVVVADTGNSRLVILDAAGRVLHVVRSGAAPFQQPFAVAAMGTEIAVLDSARGSLDLLNAGGGFIRELMHSPQLANARGLAVGPHDRLYVANPSTNSVLVLSPQGTVVQTFTGPLSAAPGGFNQPSDVAVGGDGTIYVLDNVNNRIEALTPTRAFVRQWPAPRSDTIFSVHVLPLADGRLVASDPAGALIVYRRGDSTPARLPLEGGDQSRTPVEPVGLALGPHGTLLVTDAQGGTVLLVRLSDLPH